MKIGLDSYSYHLAFGAHPDFSPRKKITIFEFFDRAVALKLDGVQLDPMHIDKKDKDYLNKISSYCSEKNLFLEYGAMGVDSEYLSHELNICTLLNSKILRTFIGFDRFDKSVHIQDEIKKSIAHLNKIKFKAEELDIKIAIENHGDVSSDELIQIVETVDSTHVGICLDVGNSMVTLQDPIIAVTKMAPYAVTTHFKDYKIRMTNYGFKVFGVALGDGDIDLFKAYKILESQRNLDRIVLEIPVEAENDEMKTLEKENSIIRRSVEYAKNVLLA